MTTEEMTGLLMEIEKLTSLFVPSFFGQFLALERGSSTIRVSNLFS